VDDLAKKIDETNGRIDELAKSLSARIDDTNKRIDELAKRIDALQTTLLEIQKLLIELVRSRQQ
jgi:peptidoglycan hydrolase CwlO-like protein